MHAYTRSGCALRETSRGSARGGNDEVQQLQPDDFINQSRATNTRKQQQKENKRASISA
jgi:hypothetical protein